MWFSTQDEVQLDRFCQNVIASCQSDQDLATIVSYEFPDGLKFRDGDLEKPEILQNLLLLAVLRNDVAIANLILKSVPEDMCEKLANSGHEVTYSSANKTKFKVVDKSAFAKDVEWHWDGLVPTYDAKKEVEVDGVNRSIDAFVLAPDGATTTLVRIALELGFFDMAQCLYDYGARVDVRVFTKGASAAAVKSVYKQSEDRQQPYLFQWFIDTEKQDQVRWILKHHTLKLEEMTFPQCYLEPREVFSEKYITKNALLFALLYKRWGQEGYEMLVQLLATNPSIDLQSATFVCENKRKLNVTITQSGAITSTGVTSGFVDEQLKDSDYEAYMEELRLKALGDAEAQKRLKERSSKELEKQGKTGLDDNNISPGFTLLHGAVMSNHPDCVRLLLAHGLNPNAGGEVMTYKLPDINPARIGVSREEVTHSRVLYLALTDIFANRNIQEALYNPNQDRTLNAKYRIFPLLFALCDDKACENLKIFEDRKEIVRTLLLYNADTENIRLIVNDPKVNLDPSSHFSNPLRSAFKAILGCQDKLVSAFKTMAVVGIRTLNVVSQDICNAVINTTSLGLWDTLVPNPAIAETDEIRVARSSKATRGVVNGVLKSLVEVKKQLDDAKATDSVLWYYYLKSFLLAIETKGDEMEKWEKILFHKIQQWYPELSSHNHLTKFTRVFNGHEDQFSNDDFLKLMQAYSYVPATFGDNGSIVDSVSNSKLREVEDDVVMKSGEITQFAKSSLRILEEVHKQLEALKNLSKEIPSQDFRYQLYLYLQRGKEATLLSKKIKLANLLREIQTYLDKQSKGTKLSGVEIDKMQQAEGQRDAIREEIKALEPKQVDASGAGSAAGPSADSRLSAQQALDILVADKIRLWVKNWYPEYNVEQFLQELSKEQKAVTKPMMYEKACNDKYAEFLKVTFTASQQEAANAQIDDVAAVKVKAAASGAAAGDGPASIPVAKTMPEVPPPPPPRPPVSGEGEAPTDGEVHSTPISAADGAGEGAAPASKPPVVSGVSMTEMTAALAGKKAKPTGARKAAAVSGEGTSIQHTKNIKRLRTLISEFKTVYEDDEGSTEYKEVVRKLIQKLLASDPELQNEVEFNDFFMNHVDDFGQPPVAPRPPVASEGGASAAPAAKAPTPPPPPPPPPSRDRSVPVPKAPSPKPGEGEGSVPVEGAVPGEGDSASGMMAAIRGGVALKKTDGPGACKKSSPAGGGTDAASILVSVVPKKDTDDATHAANLKKIIRLMGDLENAEKEVDGAEEESALAVAEKELSEVRERIEKLLAEDSTLGSDRDEDQRVKDFVVKIKKSLQEGDWTDRVFPLKAKAGKPPSPPVDGKADEGKHTTPPATVAPAKALPTKPGDPKAKADAAKSGAGSAPPPKKTSPKPSRDGSFASPPKGSPGAGGAGAVAPTPTGATPPAEASAPVPPPPPPR
jgi:hypothetical protein